MTTAKRWTPNDQQRAVLEELNRRAQATGNVSQFCKDFATFSAAKFSKIMNVLETKEDTKSYFDEIKNPDGLMEDLTEWLSKLDRIMLEKEQSKDNPIYHLSSFRAVLVSVRQCKNKPTPERITKYLAPTGASKTCLRLFLQQELANELAFSHVECRQSWKPMSRDNRTRANRTALMDISKAVGLRITDELLRKGVSGIEDALVANLTATKRVLFFDEGEFFSTYVLNLLKTLLNKTRLVAVIACTPRAHAKWNTYYADEADQIARRTHAVVKVLDVPADDAAMFFPEGQFNNTDKALELIVKAASYFGHYSLIARIAELLKKTKAAEKKEVEKSIEDARVQMGRENWDGDFHRDLAKSESL
jgi:hypothetical protein